MSAADRTGVATLAQLAERAGLSVPTVSRALRGHPDVSTGTRDRVVALAESLGYRPSAVARALRTGKFNALSFVVPYEIIGWWEPVLKGAGREASRLGFQLVLQPFEPQDAADETAPSGVADVFGSAPGMPVDGYVIVTPSSDDWKQHPNLGARPIVVIDDVRPHPDFHVLMSDNYAGAREAVEYLVASGRRSILAVQPAEPGRMMAERLAAYHDVLAEAGLPSAVFHTVETYPSTLPTSDAIDTALSEGADFDAVFVLADYAAFSVLRSCRRAGLAVPRDVAVVGFDDDIAAVALDPPLTTVAQPLAELGARAVRILVDLLAGADLPPAEHRLAAHLVKRESS